MRAKGQSFQRLAGDPATGVLSGRMAHSLRSLGSAALNHAMVVQGSLDIYWSVLIFHSTICSSLITLDVESQGDRLLVRVSPPSARTSSDSDLVGLGMYVLGQSSRKKQAALLPVDMAPLSTIISEKMS